MSENPDDGGVLGNLWDAGSELLAGAGDAIEGTYHAGVAGAEFMLGDDQGAANQWDQAADSFHDAGEHAQNAGEDLQNAYDESGIQPGDLVM